MIVYALSSEKFNYIYVGITGNLNRRIREHNAGYNRTTKPYRPFKLIHEEEFESRSEARLREKELKTTSGKRFLRGLL